MKKKLMYATFLVSAISNFTSCSEVKAPMVKGRWLGDGNWGTHMAALITAVVNTNGPVLEMGCGDYSSPLLHAICGADNRFLLSTETNETWMSLFYDLKSKLHHFHFVPNAQAWDEVGGNSHWSVVFIDHAPAERRVIDIQRLRKNTDIFVIHDTEADHVYHYEAVLSTFKYRFTYERYAIKTSLASDTIDVAALFN